MNEYTHYTLLDERGNVLTSGTTMFGIDSYIMINKGLCANVSITKIDKDTSAMVYEFADGTEWTCKESGWN